MIEYLGGFTELSLFGGVFVFGERDSKRTSLSHLSVWPSVAIEEIYRT